MAIENWMDTLKSNMESVAGIRQVHVYDELPGTLVTFPTMIILPYEGSQDIGGVSSSLHRLRMTLFLSGQVLPEAYGNAVPFIALVRNKVAADITLGGLVQHCMPLPGENFYEGPGAISYLYGDKVHVGINFYIEVKENETFTIS